MRPVDLSHQARSGTIHGAACDVKLRQQDRAAQGDMCDPARGDTQRHEAQLVLDGGARAAHDEFPAPASSSAVLGNADMTDLVGGHKIDRVRSRAPAVLPGSLQSSPGGAEDELCQGGWIGEGCHVRGAGQDLQGSPRQTAGQG